MPEPARDFHIHGSDRSGFFDPSAELKTSHRNLPHWAQGEVYTFVTFRLADSIPKKKLERWRNERAGWLAHHPFPHDAETAEAYHSRFSLVIEDWLDAGSGACWLAEPASAQIVAEAIRFFANKRYRLGPWVVMPNHVHLVIQPLTGFEVSRILHSLKSYTAQAINRRLQRNGPFWQHESYDHLIRSPIEMNRIEEYIRDNPKKAGVRGLSSFDG